ncbi:MAG: hypothetical protein AAFP85_17210 [Pseudomonadota bacterium]
MSKWMKATKYYDTNTDPLRGKRRSLAAQQGNAVRERVRFLMPEAEIVKAMGGDLQAEQLFNATNGSFEVVRVRAHLIGFIKALCLRHKHNAGKDISMANVMSLVAMHGMTGALRLPIFQPVSYPAQSNP